MGYVLIFVQLALGLAGIFQSNYCTSSRCKKTSASALIFLIMAIAAVQAYAQYNSDFTHKYDGILTSNVKSNSAYPALNFGGSILTWTGSEDTPAIQFDSDYIQIKMLNNAVRLTTQIRDIDGNLIGEIVDNHWHIYSPQFILDRNFNSNSLEIKDLRGDVTFQVELNGNEVRIAGYFYSKNGDRKVQFIGPWIKGSDPLFLYPSSAHSHTRNNVGSYTTEGAVFVLQK